MRRVSRSVLWGAALVGVGVLLLLENGEILPDWLEMGPVILGSVGLVLLIDRLAFAWGTSGGFFIPLALMGISAGLVLQDAGLVTDEFAVWPVVVIALGVAILFEAVVGRREPPRTTEHVPLDGAARARIVFAHGAGTLVIRGGAPGGEVLSGTFAGGVEPRVTRTGDGVDVELRGRQAWGRFPRDWTVDLTDDVPVTLELKTGAGRADVDLRSTAAERVSVDTGASDVTVRLPEHGRPRLTVKGGATHIRLEVPEGMAARISTRGGLSHFEIDQRRFVRDDGSFRSPGYDEAPDRADIDVEVGAASVEIA